MLGGMSGKKQNFSVCLSVSKMVAMVMRKSQKWYVVIMNEPGLLMKGTWMNLVLSLSIGHMTLYLVSPILSLPRVIVLFCSGPLFEI